MMKKNRFLALLLAMILAVALLAGCGNSANTEESSDTAAEEQTEETAEQADEEAVAEETEEQSTETASSGERTIVDQFGREIAIPEEVNTICGSFPAFDAIAVMLGAADELVAATPYSEGNEWMLRVAPNVADLPTPFAGTASENIEELMELNPDVIVCYTEDDYDALTEAGLTAVQVETTGIESIQEYIALIGEILGGESEEQAQELLEYYNENLDKVTSVTDEIAEEDRPTVFYSSDSMLTTEGTGSVMNEWIAAAGGVDVVVEYDVEGATADITEEELLEWDPDIIICRDPERVEEYKSDPTLSSLSAVQNDRVYANPTGIFPWCAYSADEAIQPLWAATVICPEEFEDVDMEQECKDFYEEFYEVDLTDDEVQEILYPND